MAIKKLTFDIAINAPVDKVWDTMLQKETYKQWTEAFSPGSSYEGSWEQGSPMRFVDEKGTGGMVSEIAENRLHEFVSIKHLSMFQNGETMSEGQDWFPAYENYTFVAKDGGTHVLIELDMAEEWEEMFTEMWPKALQKLKELCEA